MRYRQPTKRKTPPLPNDIEIDIEKYSHDGRGIGYFQGRVVFVANAMPGERVVVKLEAANSKLWQGRAVTWLATSEQRRQPACKWVGRCGGCTLQHVPHDQQLTLKQDAVMDHFQRNRVMVEEWMPAITGQEFAYRHRARLQINKHGQIGFSAPKENRVVAIDGCPVMDPLLEQAFLEVRNAAPLNGVQQLELVVDETGQIGLHTIGASESSRRALQDWAVHEKGWIVDQPMQYRALQCQQMAKPGEFTQVNRPVNEAMVQQTLAWLDLSTSDRVLDLFCGNGNFSLPIATLGVTVLGIEGSDSAIEHAQLAAQMQGLAATFMVADLFLLQPQVLADIQSFDPTVAVLDPPRAGAEPLVKAMLAWPSLQRVAYIACDPTTLARDLAIAVKAGWVVKKAGVLDMFPHTRHIESMVLLERQ